MICKNCGVELEDDMHICPLCGTALNSVISANLPNPAYGQKTLSNRKMTGSQKKFTWEIVSIILLSAAIATFIVDFVINRHISWSEYPVAICLTIFCYVSLFAFWDKTTLVEMAGGFILSSLCLVLLDRITGGIQWSIKLGVPLLFAGNIVVAILVIIIRKSRYKGINLLAYALFGAAILSMFIDGILSFYKTGLIQIQWSVIVTACVLPVFIVLLFLHFRLKKGRNLERTFHI